MDNQELLHWGIKGMKWGIRRYQNKDGSLTAAGRKRYNSEMNKLKAEEKVIKKQETTKAKLAKLDAKRAELDARKKALNEPSTDKDAVKKIDKSSKKHDSVKDMSNEELRAIVSRLQLEEQYRNLSQKQKQVSKGKKFISRVASKVVVPAIEEASKTALKTILNDAVNNAMSDNKKK